MKDEYDKHNWISYKIEENGNRLECHHHGIPNKILLIDDKIEYPCCILEFLQVNGIKIEKSMFK